MRKMVIHFRPDIEGSGSAKSQENTTDPATEKRIVKHMEVEAHHLSWRDVLSRKVAGHVCKVERMIDAATMDVALLKQVKAMKPREKLLAGAVVVAGVAGAAYLKMKSSKGR